MTHSFLDKNKQQEVIQRISKLTSDQKPIWGTMTSTQMLEHCLRVTQIYLGNFQPTPPNFILKIVGYFFKKIYTKDNRAFGKGSPTDKKLLEYTITSFQEAQDTLRIQLEFFFERIEAKQLQLQHPFFGNLTIQECAILNYKHLDHHLRQFGV